MSDLIINLTPTGAVPTKKMTPYIPLTPEEIAADVAECYQLGASMVHVHVRDQAGQNTHEPTIYAQAIRLIREQCPDIIVCASLTGRFQNTLAARSAVLDLPPPLRPEMGSLTLSSLNFTRQASVNSPEMIKDLLLKMNELGVKPELEVFDSGMVNASKYLIKKGWLQPPYYYNIILGNLYNAQPTLAEVAAILQSLPSNSIYSFGGIGGAQLKMNTLALSYASGVRVGLEDNIYLDHQRTQLATNQQLVQRIVDLAHTLGRGIASPDQVRTLLQLAPRKIPFYQPVHLLKSIDYVQQASESGHLSGDGSWTERCHDFFRQTFGFPHVLLTTSATHALEMCALLIDTQPGDEIIVPAYTFVSSANAFVLRGATIRFVDSQKEDPNLDLEHLQTLITPRTKAVVAVHYGGLSADLSKLKALCDQQKIYLIEDAAQAMGAEFRGKPLGSFGQLAVFSFHETKNLSCGEGGLLVVNDPELQTRSEIIREKGTNRSEFLRGRIERYSWIDVGSSYLLSDLLAAYLYGQLEEMSVLVDRRKKIWEQYYQLLVSLKNQLKSRFCRLNWQLPRCANAEEKSNYHLFYLLGPDKNETETFQKWMRYRDIKVCGHYLPLHQSQYYLNLIEKENLKIQRGNENLKTLKSNEKFQSANEELQNYKTLESNENLKIQSFSESPNLPNAEKFGDCLIRLPLYYNLDSRELNYIITGLSDFFS